MTAVCVQSLCKSYGSVTALKDLSFEIKQGECVGLLGPNGAGKSTTIQILTGQLHPDSGSARVLGNDPVQNPKAVHHIMGYIPDGPFVYDEISVKKNIDLFREIYKEPPSQTTKIIQKTELTEKTKVRACTLSKGLKQRLLLARTLVHTPRVILLDEPTSGLDPSSTDFICSILEELKQKGVTLMLSTHLMYLTERLCDRIILLNRGQKADEGSLAELRGRYGERQITVTFLEGEKQKTQTFSIEGDFSQKLAQVQKNKKVISVNTHEKKLEDIFIDLVRRKK